jgi:hypothetical protein
MSGNLTKEINQGILFGNDQVAKFERSNIATLWLKVVDELESPSRHKP